MNYDDIVHTLAIKGVKSGLKEEEIRNFLKDRQYCTSYVLAEATLPEEGRDAVIEYHFNTDLTKKPKLNEDGSVDFPCREGRTGKVIRAIYHFKGG